MLSDDEITSDFGEKKEEWKFGLTGYSQVVRLESSGSTCDAFTARHRNKKVFIKRLKPEFRNAPLQRAAFAKEYELGINLIHPALPVYRDCREDYIVIDYVDGVTLADMIAGRDPWLMEPGNIRKMLRQLVSVVGYLHDKNVIHSDIKTDNVMITHGTRNTMLIDLDKAYTFAHNNTGGAPANYGLEPDDEGNPAIDFHGIARIVTRLTDAGFPMRRFSGFQQMCQNASVNAELLLKELDRKSQPWGRFFAGSMILLVVAVTTVFIWLGLSSRNSVKEPVATADSVVRVDTVVIHPAAEPAEPPRSNPATAESNAEETRDLPNEPKAVSDSEKAKIVAAQEVANAVFALSGDLNNLSKLGKDTTLTSTRLLTALRDFTTSEERYFEAIKRSIRAVQPNISAEDLYVLVYNSQEARDYIKQSNSVQERIGAEFRRRYVKEHGEEPPRLIPP